MLRALTEMFNDGGYTPYNQEDLTVALDPDQSQFWPGMNVVWVHEEAVVDISSSSSSRLA